MYLNKTTLLIRLHVILFVGWSLYGCERVYKTGADVIEAKFHTPKGEFQLKYTTKHAVTNTHAPAVQGGDGNVSVRLSLFPLYGEFLLSVYNTKVKLDNKNLYCQLKGGSKYYFAAQKSGNQFKIKSPEPMSRYVIAGGGLYISGEGKRNIDSEHIRKLKKEIYQCHMPFTLNNDKYTIDVTYRLAVSTKFKIGIPAYP